MAPECGVAGRRWRRVPGGFSPPHSIAGQGQALCRNQLLIDFLTPSQTLVQTIASGVLEVIVDQSPLGPEESLEEQEPHAAESEHPKEETPEYAVAWRQSDSKTKTGKRISTVFFFSTKFSSDEHLLVRLLEPC